MSNDFSNSAQLSQIETRSEAREVAQRVILLGASNLALTFPKVVATARITWRAPLEMFVAMGFGRSYGQESKFFGKKIPGILQSDLWSALDAAPRMPTVAILADVGNDLAYEVPVETVVEWMTTTLDRLAASGARVALNNVPIESLRSVGALRFRVLRSILFPRCRLSRSALLTRAEALSGALDDLARRRKIPVFSGENAWYGLDPIHPRRASAGEIWKRMFAALDASGRVPTWMHLPRGEARQLRQLHARSWSRDARRGAVVTSTLRLVDGTTVALF
jgi:hypothetical protein